MEKEKKTKEGAKKEPAKEKKEDKAVKEKDEKIAELTDSLQRLQAVHEPSSLPDQMVAFGINAGLAEGVRKLFMSHPPLSERIAALQSSGG
jgi:uncharacterized small protein (DUF1192 family)